MFSKDPKLKIIFLFTIITYSITGLSMLLCNKMVPNWYGLIADPTDILTSKKSKKH